MDTESIIAQALAEDTGDGDHTSLATIPAGATGKARLLVKDHGVICGLGLAEKIFRQVDPALTMVSFLHDGDLVAPGDIAFEVTGPVASILGSERLVLNFMQRLSGIATETRKAVGLLAGTRTRILDTRKTTPLLRGLEKYAVRTGGGTNHRMGLYDMIMIKDNHVDFAGGIIPALGAVQRYLRETGKNIPVEIEVRNLGELDLVLGHGGVDRIMLDNFSVHDLKEAVTRIGGRFETEASGGITTDTLRAFAETGVDYISMGALTHHIRSLDMSLKAG